MTRHDSWANYERAVDDATQDLTALSNLLEAVDSSFPQEWLAPATAAEYALSDPLCALQEAETWSQARSALLFWAQRWPRAELFVTLARPSAGQRRADAQRRAGDVATELAFSNHALSFCLSELDARLVAFRDVRPHHLGAAGRLAYLEHRHA